MKFKNELHGRAYYGILRHMRASGNDVYRRKAFAYLIAADEACRQHYDRVYNFTENCINRECLDDLWQTGTSLNTTLLAFNLFTGSILWCDDNDKCLVTPAELFGCDLAPYYWEAIKLRYPEYTAK